MKRPSFSEIILIIVIVILALSILILLLLWTNSVRANRQEESIRRILQEIVEEGGEKRIFEMAGLNVEEISYGNEGLSLYEGDSGSWNYTQNEARIIALYKASKGKVVQIQARSQLSDSGQGSGVIVSDDGYIVTNRHVLSSGDQFDINFYDGSTKVGRLIGYDELTDIALLKVDGVKDLEYIEFGDSDELVIGESVIAIGNPYGFTWSLTTGVISGLNRMVFTSSGSVIPNMIQTDALINPGNSGGPLLDGSGKMVGLISSIYSTSGSSQGISFALPSETVEDVVNSLMTRRVVQRGWMDILSVELNPQMVSYLGLPINSGILVSQTVPGGEADKGGIKGGSERAQYGSSIIYLGGDIITKINGEPIDNYDDFFALLFSTKPNEEVDVTVFRDGSEKTLSGVRLVEMNEDNIKWILR